MTKLLAGATYGKEDPERAMLPFIIGNIAATAGQEAVVLLTVEGVRLATKGYADTIEKAGFPPLRDTLRSFLENGGKIWACGTCAKPRDITADDLIDGAEIVTAAFIVEYLSQGGVNTLDW